MSTFPRSFEGLESPPIRLVLTCLGSPGNTTRGSVSGVTMGVTMRTAHHQPPTGSGTYRSSSIPIHALELAHHCPQTPSRPTSPQSTQWLTRSGWRIESPQGVAKPLIGGGIGGGGVAPASNGTIAGVPEFI